MRHLFSHMLIAALPSLIYGNFLDEGFFIVVRLCFLEMLEFLASIYGINSSKITLTHHSNSWISLILSN